MIRFINSLRNLDLHSPQMEVDKLILQLNGQDFDIAKNVSSLDFNFFQFQQFRSSLMYLQN